MSFVTEVAFVSRLHAVMSSRFQLTCLCLLLVLSTSHSYFNLRYLYLFINPVARSHGYPEWNHVLYPKSAGLAAVLSCMRLQQNTFNFEASSNYSTHSAYKSIYRIRSKSNLSEKSVNGSGGSEKSKLQSRAVHDITIAYDRYISKSGGSCGQRYNEWSLASGELLIFSICGRFDHFYLTFKAHLYPHIYLCNTF